MKRLTPSLLAAALVLTFGCLPRQAEAGVSLSQGRFTFGVSGGFSQNSFALGGSVGYLVADGFQPILSATYSYRNSDYADAHQLQTMLELRYYLIQTGSFAPYLSGEVGHVFLSYSGGVDESHNIGYAGGAVGFVYFFTRNIGFQLGVGIGKWLGADQQLYDRGTLDEGVVITGRFGLSFLY